MSAISLTLLPQQVGSNSLPLEFASTLNDSLLMNRMLYKLYKFSLSLSLSLWSLEPCTSIKKFCAGKCRIHQQPYGDIGTSPRSPSCSIPQLFKSKCKHVSEPSDIPAPAFEPPQLMVRRAFLTEPHPDCRPTS